MELEEVEGPPAAQPLDLMALRRTITGLCDDAQAEWSRLKRFDMYLHGHHDKPKFSPEVETAYGLLWKASTINYIPLVVGTLAQRLAVDGYRASQEEQQPDSTAWTLWQANGLDGRQHKLYTATLEYGYAYCSVLPAVGAAPVRIRPLSPRQVYCAYEDDDDEWPMFAYREEHCYGSGAACEVQLWDSAFHYTLMRSPSGVYDIVDIEANAAGVVPFVRFRNVDALDDDRPPMGEIEPIIHVQDQLNRLTFIVNLIAEKTSFTIKWMMGVEIPRDPVTGEPVAPWRAMPGEIWTINADASNAGSKVGEFTPDNPAALISYRDKIRRDMFSLAQIPPHYGDNEMANLSAEAFAAAEATLTQKVDERHGVLGESWEQVLRLAAWHVGDIETASDESAQIFWRDTSPRALSQTADAVLKLQQAGVPVEATWLMLPGVSRQDVEEWTRLRAQEQGGAVLAQLGQQAAGLLAGTATPQQPAIGPTAALEA
jgi:hypothetical protein